MFLTVAGGLLALFAVPLGIFAVGFIVGAVGANCKSEKKKDKVKDEDEGW